MEVDEKENVQLQAGKCKRKPMIFYANLIIQRVAVLRAELKRSSLRESHTAETRNREEWSFENPFICKGQ